MKRFQFSLRAFLIVPTVSVFFLTYSQWRRVEIIRTYRQFDDVGADVDIPASFVDYIWQRHPRVVRVTLNPIDGAPRKFPNRNLDHEYRRLKQAGIEKVFWVLETGSNRYESIPFEEPLIFDQSIPQPRPLPEVPFKIEPRMKEDAIQGSATLSYQISMVGGPHGATT